MEETKERTATGFNRTVAILCAAPQSVYRWLPDLEVYDRNRDIRTFPGGMPVVAHPPCRAWSHYLKRQAKPEPGEKQLGLLCARILRECGGVLEQPAYSGLWTAARLPLPGNGHRSALWSLEVEQSWWGHPTPKPTWLCFSGIKREEVILPEKSDLCAGSKCKSLGAAQRSATPPGFANWLIELARMAKTREYLC